MKTIAYLRVSTDEQSLGLDAQRMACESYCKNQGLELNEVFFDEGLSGALSFDKRPGILNSIASLERGAVLLVAKRDRLSRGDVLAMAMIEAGVARKGAKIVSTAGEGTENEDPSSILMRRMVDAFGEYERLIIKSRTKAALQTKKARGERVGHIPFGFKLADNGIHLEQCDIEQDILKQISDLKEQGLILKEIVEELNNKNIFNRGTQWTLSSVHRMAKKAA
jgi:DNA invertase Pin-like site-specific DNA recombinase